MQRVKCKKVQSGLVSFEKIVRLKTADNREEELAVPSQIVRKDQTIPVSAIGRQGRKTLIELPRETVSGRWRIWVGSGSVRT